MTGARETVTTIDLGYEQLFVFEGGPAARVRVLYGATWLTEEGEPADTIVGGGKEVALHGGRAVVEGLEPTRLQIVEVWPPRGLRHAGQRLRRAAGELRARLGRLQLGMAATGSGS
jgi:hypothetical protein